jgi:hypothetical protein
VTVAKGIERGMGMARAMDDPQVAALVGKLASRAQLADEAKTVAKEYRERLENLDSEIRLLAEDIRDGQRTLFGDVTNGAVEKLASDPGVVEALGRMVPRKGSGIESVSFGPVDGPPSVTLTAEDGERIRAEAKRLRGPLGRKAGRA